MLGDSCHFMPDFKEMKKGFIRLERRHVYFRERKRKEKKENLSGVVRRSAHSFPSFLDDKWSVRPFYS
jgi:hypothetical protein